MTNQVMPCPTDAQLDYNQQVQAIARQITSWLESHQGVKILSTLKVKGRCVVYQTVSGKKGCCFVPKRVLVVEPTPIRRNQTKGKQFYYVVCDSDRQMYTADYQLVELTEKQAQEIKSNGGLIFTDRVQAAFTSGNLNYPEGYKGVVAKKAGFGERSYYAPRFLDLRIIKS